jgi:tripartite-type tricarboxylate transporter receptor subunit TctC
MISRRNIIMSSACATAALPLAQTSWAQATGLSNPVRIVVGYPPGGASDRAARLIAERLQARLSTPVIVENRVGAGGRLAAQQLAKAPSNQTLLMIGNPAVMTVAPIVSTNIGYDPDLDFVPLSYATEYEFGLAVGRGLPLNQLSHVMAWIQANPDKANIGVPATGSLPHFFALMMGFMTNAKLEVIGYRGSAPMLTDLIGGQIPISIDTLDSLIPQHEAGKIRLLATSGSRRSSLAPSVSTFREAGLPIIAAGWNVMYAPASTPKPVQALLAKTLFEIMSEPATQQSFRAAKMDPIALNDKQTVAALKKFNDQWRPIIKRSGFKATT